MPIVMIHAWEGNSDAKNQELLVAVTDAVHDVTAVPKDRIIVVMNEARKSQWAQNGVIASDPRFMEKSQTR